MKGYRPCKLDIVKKSPAIHSFFSSYLWVPARSRDLWRTPSIFANNGERGFAVPKQATGAKNVTPAHLFGGNVAKFWDNMTKSLHHMTMNYD